MAALLERWPALAALSHLPLLAGPTPVQRLSRCSRRLGSEVYVKRDDETATPYGGNKVRKLEFLLGEAQRRGADTILTTGAAGSHHVFATSLYAQRMGVDTHAVLVPQPHTAHVEAQLRADLAIGTRLVPAARFGEVPARLTDLSLRLRVEGRRPYVVPPGGSSVLGTLGFVSAGVELATQIDAGLLPEPDVIYVPCGTCATAAGLTLGLAAAGVRTEVVAVRVTDRMLANRRRLSRLVRRAQRLLRGLDPRFPRVAEQAIEQLRFDHGEVGRGYGRPTPRGESALEFAAQDHMLLDPTYTAKAFAALMREAEHFQHGKRLLFWNTLSSAPMDVFSYPDELAPALMALMTR